jgi:NADPH-dependent curcumin reductase CurA
VSFFFFFFFFEILRMSSFEVPEVSNKQVIFKNYVVGKVKDSDLEIRTSQLRLELPEDGTNDVLVKNLYLSADPYMRPRMKEDYTSYIPPFTPGKPIDGYGVSKVVLSKNPAFKEGDYVTSFTRWEEYSVIPGGNGLKVIDTSESMPLSYYLGCLGMPGFTAYVGLYEILKPKQGETIYVSAASGAVGQLVGQLAKLAGLYVVGSAGSQQKIDLLKEKLGYNAAFNYKQETDYNAALKKYCPKGIDMYFENVGGKMLEAVLDNMNKFGRIAVCGLISQYEKENSDGIHNLWKLISARITMRGFLQGDHANLQPEFLQKMLGYLKEKKFVYIEDIDEGLESAVGAFVKLLSGGNVGKQILKVATD